MIFSAKSAFKLDSDPSIRWIRTELDERCNNNKNRRRLIIFWLAYFNLDKFIKFDFISGLNSQSHYTFTHSYRWSHTHILSSATHFLTGHFDGCEKLSKSFCLWTLYNVLRVWEIDVKNRRILIYAYCKWIKLFAIHTKIINVNRFHRAANLIMPGLYLIR